MNSPLSHEERLLLADQLANAQMYRVIVSVKGMDEVHMNVAAQRAFDALHTAVASVGAENAADVLIHIKAIGRPA